MQQVDFDWSTITQIPGGWRVKTNAAGTHYIDVLLMLYNCRIVTTPVDRPGEYDRFWCYAGTDAGALLGTIAEAAMWDGADVTEPDGWIRNGQTSERSRA